MMARLVVALLAVAGVTAFAPAPFPKPDRKGGDGNEITVPIFQGTWRVTGMVRTSKDGNHSAYTWAVTHVRVREQTWTFVNRNDVDSNSYSIVIKNAQKPATLDFHRGVGVQEGAQQAGTGIIRRKGDVVEIIYVFGGNRRAVSFEQPPDNQYLLTLQRQR